MIPVRDADGTLVYMKKPTQSVSSTGDVFDTLPGQRRPSQDDLYRTGERNGGYVRDKISIYETFTHGPVRGEMRWGPYGPDLHLKRALSGLTMVTTGPIILGFVVFLPGLISPLQIKGLYHTWYSLI